MAYATIRGQSTTSWSRYVLALCAAERRDMLQRFLLPRIDSILRRFVQGATPTHERSKTARHTARAPPKRQVGSRARDASTLEH